MITLLQHKSSAYPPRTYENASADLTIAFAFDFNTPGERLTYDAVRSQGKLYARVRAMEKEEAQIASLAKTIIEAKVKTVNIAGNGLYTIVRYGNYTQQDVDNYVTDYMQTLVKKLPYRQINLIRSGVQSGFDEAGLKAAEKLGIKSIGLCPNGWKYRDAFGLTVCDELLFKERFIGYNIS